MNKNNNKINTKNIQIELCDNYSHQVPQKKLPQQTAHIIETVDIVNAVNKKHNQSNKSGTKFEDEFFQLYENHGYPRLHRDYYNNLTEEEKKQIVCAIIPYPICPLISGRTKEFDCLIIDRMGKNTKELTYV